MSKTEIKPLIADDGSELLSHYRITKNKFGQEIGVPVVDVRDGITYRMLAMHTIVSNNRSRYMNYNQYHQSRKPKQQI